MANVLPTRLPFSTCLHVRLDQQCVRMRDVVTALSGRGGTSCVSKTSLERPWRMTMTNERLRDAISAHGLTSVKLAERVAVDPKTVERWITTGRVPHRTHRGAVASIIGMDEGYLWPSVRRAGRALSSADGELVTMYPTRGSVPGGLWLALVNQATTSIDT